LNETEIHKVLTGVFRDAFGRETMTITRSMSATDVEGWDSIKMVAILMGVEERFNIKLRSRDTDRLETVGDLMNLIRAKTGG
jgi:acyl carrier protein